MQHCSRCWPGFIVPALYKVRGEGTPGTAGPYGGLGGGVGKPDCEWAEHGEANT